MNRASPAPQQDRAPAFTRSQIMDALEMNVRMFAMQTAPTPAATSPSDEVDKALLNVKNGIIGHNLDHQDNIKLLGDDIVGGLETNMEKVYRVQFGEAFQQARNTQVPEHVKRLLRESVGPTPLNRQVEEMKERTEKLRIEIQNSRARRRNNRLVDPCDLSEHLTHVVVFAAGGKSKACEVFPKDIQSFLYYPDDQIKRLFEYYDLGKPGLDRSANLNRFMAYIGTPFTVSCPPSPASLPTPTSPVTGIPSVKKKPSV